MCGAASLRRGNPRREKIPAKNKKTGIQTRSSPGKDIESMLSRIYNIIKNAANRVLHGLGG